MKGTGCNEFGEGVVVLLAALVIMLTAPAAVAAPAARAGVAPAATEQPSAVNVGPPGNPQRLPHKRDQLHNWRV
jgi:hypothetical protein